MPESGSRRCETYLARRSEKQMVSREGLDEAGLPIAAGAEYRALCRGCGPSADYYVDCSLLARVLTRRSTALDRTCHFCELLFLFGFWQRTNLLFVMFFRCENVRHESAVENSADGFDICDLRVVFEPNWMRKSPPG